jgi:chitosanase
MRKTILTLLIILLFIPSALAGSNAKNAMLQMTTTLENSETQLQFNYAENIGDGRGITFGCIGFCTGTYDGNVLIHYYTTLNPDNSLSKYIPALDKIDAGSHNAAGGDGNPSVAGLNGFINDVKNCNDPLFKQAQLYELDQLYYNPAVSIANKIGAKNALTLAFIYDMCVRHGSDGAQSMVNKATSQCGGTPASGVSETVYLSKLISIRDSALKSEGLGDINRDAGFKNVLSSGNVNLTTPFTFVAYGDSFTITGDLGIDTGDVTPINNTTTPVNNTYQKNGKITWKGQDWEVYPEGRSDPGPNNWNPNGVYVDPQGRMHLTVEKAGSTWKACGIDAKNKTKYGTYTWTLDSPNLQNLDKNVVLGLFTYLNDATEQDIEFSQWGSAKNDLLSFSVQPKMIGAFPVTSQPVKCQIVWQKNKCTLTVWDTAGKVIGTATTTKYVPTKNSYACMNLWLNDGHRSPSNGQPVDIVISDFSFIPNH